jgi:hypothetical protein
MFVSFRVLPHIPRRVLASGRDNQDDASMQSTTCFTFQALGQIARYATTTARPWLQGLAGGGNKQCVCLAFLQVFMRQPLALPANTVKPRTRVDKFYCSAHEQKKNRIPHRSHLILLKIEKT